MKTKFKNGRDCKLKERGVAAVEFAIVISLLVLIVGGIIEFGRVMWYLDALTKATRDGARFMSTVANTNISTAAEALASDPPYTSSNPLTVRSIVVNAASAANVAPVLTNVQVSVSCEPAACLNSVAPDYVTVAITGFSVNFGSWFVIPLPSGPWALTPHTTMRYMCDAGAATPC